MKIYPTTGFAARGSWPRVTVVLTAIALAILTAACERYVRVAPARYPDIGTISTEKWRVETEDMVYRVHRITATDSALIIDDFKSTETKATPSNPMRPVRVANPTAPVTLSYGEVVKLERITQSHGNAVAALVLLTVVSFAVWIALFSQ